jgi:hypothetical protein
VTHKLSRSTLLKSFIASKQSSLIDKLPSSDNNSSREQSAILKFNKYKQRARILLHSDWMKIISYADWLITEH